MGRVDGVHCVQKAVMTGQGRSERVHTWTVSQQVITAPHTGTVPRSHSYDKTSSRTIFTDITIFNNLEYNILVKHYGSNIVKQIFKIWYLFD